MSEMGKKGEKRRENKVKGKRERQKKENSGYRSQNSELENSP